MSEHPYDGCPDCVERVRKVLSEAPEAVRGTRRPATAAQLERHARRFGPEAVAETAEELGVTVKVERPKPKRRARGGQTLKERVAWHLANGRSAELIAELENLSPSRARRIIEEVRHG